MKSSHARFGLGLLLITFSGQLLAQDLDAPLTTKPTLRTEIHQGREASSACQYGPGDDYLAYSHCVENVVTQANSSGAISEPFKLGVYSNAWELSDINLQVLLSNNSFPEQIDEMKRFGWFFYKSTTDLQRDLKLNNQKLCLVTKVHDCSWYDRMDTYWSVLPKP